MGCNTAPGPYLTCVLLVGFEAQIGTINAPTVELPEGRVSDFLLASGGTSEEGTGQAWGSIEEDGIESAVGGLEASREEGRTGWLSGLLWVTVIK